MSSILDPIEKKEIQNTAKKTLLYNRFLEYLLDNDPEIVVNEKGIKNRKVISPLFNAMLKILNPYKLEVERKYELPNDEPTIFVASHGFRDDILNTLLTIDDNVYILFGVIDQFFNTIDGIKLWLSGVIPVDRGNKESRASSKPKMERALNLGANVVDFFEATWNLSDNLLVESPHIGIYDVAEKTKRKLAPITTHVEVKKFRSVCHTILGERYDITKLTQKRAEETLSLVKKSLIKISDLLIYNDSYSVESKNQIKDLFDLVNEKAKNDEVYDIEYIESLLDLISNKANDIRTFIDNKNDVSDNDIIDSILKRVSNILRVVIYAKKIVAIRELRDIIASHKYELMEKYSNYSNIPRSELEKDESLRDQWEKYKNKLVKQVKYYDLEREQSYIYKDPTIYSEKDVFSVIEGISSTNSSPVLSMAKK